MHYSQKSLFLIGAMLIAAVPLHGARAQSGDPRAITQAELERRTQELMDSIVAGDKIPWQKYYADDCLFFDEKGRSMTKPQLVADIQPLPKGYGGSIRLAHVQSRFIGNTAIISYDLDESETVWSQELKARYHATDTWMYRKGRWQIVATQVHRYYEDPAPGKADPARFADYVGTYQLAPGVTITVTADGDQLYAERNGRSREKLIPETSEVFFRPGVEGRRLFRYGPNGKVDALIDRRNNEDIIWKRVP